LEYASSIVLSGTVVGMEYLLVTALKSVLFTPINVRITWKNTNVSKMVEKIFALQHINLKLFYNITFG